MMAKKEKNQKSLKTYLKYELYGIVIIILSVISLAQEGSVGKATSFLFKIFVGTWNFIFPLLGIVLGISVMIKRGWPSIWTVRISGIYLFFLSFLLMAHMPLVNHFTASGTFNDLSIVSLTWDLLMKDMKSPVPTDVGGGMIGALTFALLNFLFGHWGIRVVISAMILVGFLLVTGVSYVQIMEKIRSCFKTIGNRIKMRLKDFIILISDHQEPHRISIWKRLTSKQKDDSIADKEDEPVIYDFSDQVQPSVGNQTEVDSRELEQQKPIFFDFEANRKRMEEKDTTNTEEGPQASSDTIENSEEEINLTLHSPDSRSESVPPYSLPSFSLLDKPKGGGKNGEHRDITANAKKLEATLESFGVRARVTQIHRGPAVTRYEVQPDVGVKVSRIVNLTDDIALSLAARDIRIEAPIPGKAAVGIEVPNSEVSIVTLREVLESSSFHESPSKLSIALGRDISGEPIVGNLAKMPHLLVAGATGSGKSVCINGIIASVLYKAKPNEVKFLMVDPKMVELNVYNGIPHLLAPVVTDPRRASMALKKVVVEMEKRYELFSQSGTRDIERYNAQIAAKNDPSQQPLPYIIVIVDELADLMMVAPADVEDAICRLAQMARAAGIHLIIATQRPSVDVITGVIKANIPSRIAFGVSSMMDSRTILDMGGAEKLLGRGDMLYLPVGASKPVRVQGAFLSDHEVEAIVQFAKDQQKAKYQEDIVPQIEESESNNEVGDDMYDQAVQTILEAKQASVSLLQRRLRIGYTRAARLIDAMEAKGIVGPYEGSKPREVLISIEQWNHSKLSS
jgi:S-DNA-T family DNA segregation ATPase FtsK/SpoIIIE